MSRPRLTYVGHSYHAQTGSTLFLQDLLASTFDVTTIWDESWRPDTAPLRAKVLNATHPDVLVLFQQLPRRAEYAQIECANVTLIPMHDGIGYGSHWVGWRRSGMKVLCFCAKDRAYFSGLGFDTLHVQYAPPVRADVHERTFSVFFWMRRNEIGWDTLKRLLGSQRPERIVLRVAPDPGHAPVLPSEEDRRAYSIEVHEGWMDAERYRQLLGSCSVFMAPRPSEGIGQALLDARAMGLVAVAPDAPTMNEYLRHGETGYLYDLHAPAPLDFSDFARVSQRSIADLGAVHDRWLASRAAVLEFVRKPTPPQPLWWRLRSRLARH
jgi:glycosyltransferase involved in cell wall biosynthesis